MIEYNYEESKNRIAAYYKGKEVGEITYSKAGENILIVDHTYVNEEYRGKSIANQLVKNVVDLAISQNKKIVPLCSFVRKEFDRNPEYQEVESK
ncbi:N-acetyltransferase [Clostridioides mangenotii]|uniref:GNAT family N-acetyltransferase n=1 Tax=Metaclostridioides mangenotii TaxID=1540 RepID=UPI001C1202A3|nr:GNAT family N-acetyltransferase [Clostridioides mangenotii]MBU5307914.1 N-acetyltransferase [Clostridioides mangenotii]